MIWGSSNIAYSLTLHPAIAIAQIKAIFFRGVHLFSPVCVTMNSMGGDPFDAFYLTGIFIECFKAFDLGRPQVK
jgi:hypothetical protein